MPRKLPGDRFGQELPFYFMPESGLFQGFSIPADPADAYTYRIGCTGRVEKDGDTLTLMTREDEPRVRGTERAHGKKWIAAGFWASIMKSRHRRPMPTLPAC